MLVMVLIIFYYIFLKANDLQLTKYSQFQIRMCEHLNVYACQLQVSAARQQGRALFLSLCIVPVVNQSFQNHSLHVLLENVILKPQ